MELKKLYEQREDLQKEMETILDSAKTEERAMSEDETTKFDDIEAKIKAIDKTIQCEERAREIKMLENTMVNEIEKEDVAQVEERAFVDFIRGTVTENRADSFLTQGSNGTVVPRSIADRIITAVKDQVDFMKYANVVFANGTLAFPVYSDTNEANYVDETLETEAKNGAFTTIDLTGFVIEAISIVSKKMITNVDFDIVSFVINEVVKKIVNKLEKEFINGTTNKITGVLSTTNTVETASSTTITYDELVKTKHTLKQAFQGNGVWVMHPDTYTAICLLKDGNEMPYFKDDEYVVLNRPVLVSDNMPSMAAGNKAIVYADLSGYTIKMAKSVEVNLLNELYARKNAIGVQGIVEVDAKITDEQKIVALTMKTA